jgi:uncharacterized membrane protein
VQATRQANERRSQDRQLVASGILLGMGLGGFFDGIVLHQILQWHHLVSNVDRYPMTTVAGLEANTLADGLFHAATYVFTVVGFVLLWNALRHPEVRWSGWGYAGLLLAGWGIFNLVEGLINHQILQVHRVKQNAADPLLWDVGFLVWGAMMLLAGWWLARRERG